ncbi:hypothetical protein [Clostridium sp. VAP41]|uniref:hypothetical protein n=1 Tax=Clostridium sp. VAP41 TaxID=2949979 RepID=UPI00207962B2|nr:hypothetical protein [Clostridium sp. VAP41]
MSEEDRLKEISESLKIIADSTKPKLKKTSNTIAIGWLFIGIISLYALYEVYKVFCR